MRLLFILLACSYLSLNFVMRWMRHPLFSGHGAYGWPQASNPDLASFILLLVSPVFILGALVYFLSGRSDVRAIINGVIAFSLATIAFEPLYGWYSISHTFPTLDQYYMFLTEDWQHHFGISEEMTARLLQLAAVHLFAYAAAAVVAVTIAPRLWRWLPSPRRSNQIVAIGALALLIANVALVAHYVQADNPQWLRLGHQSILHPTRLEERYFRDSDKLANLAQINALLHGEFDHPPGAEGATETPGYSGPHFPGSNILIIAVEGWSPRYISADTMPFLAGWSAKNAVSGSQHYSSGNNTLNGVLGLIHGVTPLQFYEAGSLGRQSKFINQLNQQGYRTRRYSTDLSSYRQIDRYLRNFTLPALDIEDDWNLIDPIVTDLGQRLPQLSFVYYGSTHFPYLHEQRYRSFQPEVPDDFDYTSWDLRDHIEAVRNRYRNCLLELDDWLRTLTHSIDLDNTIVVLTGDHGEAFFEKGRLGHSSTLEREMIETPLYIFYPGSVARRIASVTSHLDIMPTVFDLLGLPAPGARFGRSLLGPSTPGGAIVVLQNKPWEQRKWGVVTGSYKTIWQETIDGDARVVGLYDSDDQPMAFRDQPDVWPQNIAFARRMGVHATGRSN